MIVVNRYWLVHIGMPPAVAYAIEDAPGLMLSVYDAFARGPTGGRYTSALYAEHEPRTLLLLGMRERYGAASGTGASVIEIGLDGYDLRYPSRSERQTIFDALAYINHPTSDAIRAALLEITVA